MTVPDVADLVAKLIAAASDAISKDITAQRGYAAAKLQAVAKQAAMIAAAYAKGEITQEELAHFEDGLKDMVTSFTRVLVGLAAIDAEKAWNAMVGVLWDALGTATRGALKLG